MVSPLELIRPTRSTQKRSGVNMPDSKFLPTASRAIDLDTNRAKGRLMKNEDATQDSSESPLPRCSKATWLIQAATRKPLPTVLGGKLRRAASPSRGEPVYSYLTLA